MPGLIPMDKCPDAASHFAGLLGYPDDMDEDTGISPTLRQAICPSCGFWALWIPRE